jgi:hypothetical protein
MVNALFPLASFMEINGWDHGKQITCQILGIDLKKLIYARFAGEFIVVNQFWLEKLIQHNHLGFWTIKKMNLELIKDQIKHLQFSP